MSYPIAWYRVTRHTPNFKSIVRMRLRLYMYRIGVYFAGENFHEFRRSVPVCENIICEYCMRAPRPLALACSDSGGVADIMAISENFIRKTHKCQPFVKIFSHEINPLYGMSCTCILPVLSTFALWNKYKFTKTIDFSTDLQRLILTMRLNCSPSHLRWRNLVQVKSIELRMRSFIPTTDLKFGTE